MKTANLKNLDRPGIYIIRNLANNKMYIGSAQNMKQRFHEHYSLLRRNKHHSSYLQNSYNKYPDQIFFFVLEPVKNKQFLIKREQYWLDFYKSYKKQIGYNQQPNAHNSLGRKLSEETKKKIGDGNSKQIKSITLDGKIIVFKSCNEAYLYYNCGRATVWYNLHNKTFSRKCNCYFEYL